MRIVRYWQTKGDRSLGLLIDKRPPTKASVDVGLWWIRLLVVFGPPFSMRDTLDSLFRRFR